MRIFETLRPATLVLAAGLSLAVAVPAPAQTSAVYGDRDDSWYRSARETGYSAGFERGAADARARADFDYARDPDFRRGDLGYRRDSTSAERYRQVFREGFMAGYEDGYQGYDEARSVRQPLGISGGVLRVPRTDIAFEYGYADGYKAGVDDARHNKFKPTDHGDYRKADRGYEGRYGSRDAYRVDYRDGFAAGYSQAYRERLP